MTAIRPLLPADESQWRPLWRGYLEFYRTAIDEATTAATFSRLTNEARFFAFVAERAGVLTGVVHCIVHPGTWSTRDYCYLGDLFVAPAERGQGTGRALIEAVYSEAQRRGLDRVYWLTHETNAAGRALYDTLASFDGFIQYRHKL